MLLSHLVKAAGKQVVDWEMKLGSILKFTGRNGYKETDPLVLLSPERQGARKFVFSFVESRSSRLSSRSEEFRKGTEEEQRWHLEFTNDLVDDKDFFPVAVSRERFMEGPGKHAGKRGSAKKPLQETYVLYQSVLRAHGSFVNPTTAQEVADVMWSQELVVVKRPKVHRLNHVLLGQGLGFHLMSYDEGKYLKPFIKASRMWLGKSLVAFPSLEALTSAILKAVVVPTRELLESLRPRADEQEVALPEVRCGLCSGVREPRRGEV